MQSISTYAQKLYFLTSLLVPVPQNTKARGTENFKEQKKDPER